MRTDPGSQRTQEARGLDGVFKPRSVAVIGASPRPENLGHRVFANIVDGGFRGAAYPVHPLADKVAGHDAFRRITDIPGNVDLAVVVVPAEQVLEVARECAAKGVRGLVVISAGFREIGALGEDRERRLRDILQASGMRLIGPNCLGVLNPSPDVRLFATFADTRVQAGPMALMTQSGAVGLALLERAAERHLGVARFASMGNKLDVSSNDLLLLWENDPEVRVILLYLEGFGNPRNFVRIARRVGKTKPIVVVKSGRSRVGAKAATSHTGALAEADLVVDALFDQCGVLRADTVDDMFDLAAALVSQPLPRSGRVGVITNSGGPGIMAADAADATRLELPAFSEATASLARRLLPAEASISNPMDLLAAGGPMQYEQLVAAALEDPAIDALVPMCTPIRSDDTEIARAILRGSGSARGRKPLLGVLIGRTPGDPGARILADGGIPTYPFPEPAIRVIAGMRRLAAFRERGDEEPILLPITRPTVRSSLSATGWLRQDRALDVVRAGGIQAAPYAFATDSSQAADIATRLGFPVAVKVEAKGIVHKSDVGGVRLGLASAADVRRAFDEIRAAVAARGHEFHGTLVMKQARGGHEFLVGGIQDPKFGPLVALGLGGLYAEVFKDVVFRLAPLSRQDAHRMIRSLRSFPLLEGARGQPPGDVDALADVLLRVGTLLHEFPQIAELEMNPVLVHAKGEGLDAVDARVRVAASDA